MAELPRLQQEDSMISMLRHALQHPDDRPLPGTVANLLPRSFITPESNLVWVRQDAVDKILVPAVAQQRLIELIWLSCRDSSNNQDY